MISPETTEGQTFTTRKEGTMGPLNFETLMRHCADQHAWQPEKVKRFERFCESKGAIVREGSRRFVQDADRLIGEFEGSSNGSNDGDNSPKS